MKYTRKELLSVPKRKWSEVLSSVSGVYVIPSGRKHDSGFACMDFVAEFKDGEKPMVRFGGICDDVSLIGMHFRMDCLHPQRIIHIWNHYPFYITDDLSSINFVEEGSKMTDREKLIELIGEMQLHGYVEKHDADGVWCWRPSNELLATHLLANGVRLETKQATSDKASEWISVEDKLPESGRYLVFQKSVISSGHCAFATFTQCYSGLLGDPMNGKQLWYKYDGEYGDYEVTNVTHWMPLPEAPKED